MKSLKTSRRMLRWCPVRTYAIAAVALLVSGCTRSDAPPLAKVSGVVSLEGNPLSVGSIQFLPDSEKGTSGRMAVGALLPDGTFELTTIKPGDGAQVGFHKVAIQAFEVSDPNSGLPPKALIPVMYSDPETSGLTAEVKAGQMNSLNFELTKSAK